MITYTYIDEDATLEVVSADAHRMALRCIDELLDACAEAYVRDGSLPGPLPSRMALVKMVRRCL